MREPDRRQKRPNPILFEISNGRLPFEDGSDWRETLAKRVSDHLQFLIFDVENFFEKYFFAKILGGRFFFQKSEVLEGQ